MKNNKLMNPTSNKEPNFPDIRIEMKKELDIKTIEIIEAYWKFEKGNFVYRPYDISRYFNMTVPRLANFVKSNSRATLKLENCLKCNQEISYSLSHQSKAKEIIEDDNGLCENCQKNFESDLSLLKEDELKEYQLKHALKIQYWKRLTKYELFIFKEIIRIDHYQDIYMKLYSDDEKFKKNWPIIVKLNRLDLIRIVRDLGTNKVVEFSFLPEYKKVFNIKSINIKNDSNKRARSNPQSISRLIPKILGRFPN